MFIYRSIFGIVKLYFDDKFAGKPLKENQKLHKERLRQEKLKLKEQKKKEDQEYKEMKNALAKLYGNMKPENCINVYFSYFF